MQAGFWHDGASYNEEWRWGARVAWFRAFHGTQKHAASPHRGQRGRGRGDGWRWRRRGGTSDWRGRHDLRGPATTRQRVRLAPRFHGRREWADFMADGNGQSPTGAPAKDAPPPPQIQQYMCRRYRCAVAGAQCRLAAHESAAPRQWSYRSEASLRDPAVPGRPTDLSAKDLCHERVLATAASPCPRPQLHGRVLGLRHKGDGGLRRGRQAGGG
jgi:hypothetical protein